MVHLSSCFRAMQVLTYFTVATARTHYFSTLLVMCCGFPLFSAMFLQSSTLKTRYQNDFQVKPTYTFLNTLLFFFGKGSHCSGLHSTEVSWFCPLSGKINYFQLTEKCFKPMKLFLATESWQKYQEWCADIDCPDGVWKFLDTCPLIGSIRTPLAIADRARRNATSRERRDGHRLNSKEHPCLKQVLNSRAARARQPGALLSVPLYKQVTQPTC